MVFTAFCRFKREAFKACKVPKLSAGISNNNEDSFILNWLSSMLGFPVKIAIASSVDLMFLIRSSIPSALSTCVNWRSNSKCSSELAAIPMAR